MFFKGILAQPGRPGAELRHAARAGHAQSARSLHDERHGQRACCIFPRYMMITGITVLALAFCLPELQAMEKPDFEKLLPIVLTQ